MSKILKMNIQDELETMQRGGGSPNLAIPQTIDKLNDIRNKFLEKLNNSVNDNENTEYIFYLTHTTELPPISKRFTEGLRTIFGESSFWYKRNELVDDKLIFVYVVKKYQLEIAVDRIDKIIEYVNYVENKYNLKLPQWFGLVYDNKSDSISPLFLDELKSFFYEYKLISKTSLIKLLSTCSEYCEDIKFKDYLVVKEEDKIIFTKFINKASMEIAKKQLEENNIKYNIVDTKDCSMEILNEDGKYFHLNNALYTQNIGSISLKREDAKSTPSENFIDIYHSYDINTISNNVNVGVIDGGIQNEHLKKYLASYHNYEEFNITQKPSGNHAEEVCGVLLFANKLSIKMDDNCRKPNVHLFDVCHDDMKPSKFIEVVEQIVEKYHEQIKIWNISIVSSLSPQEYLWTRGVSQFAIHFDKIQKKYGVLFVIASGNKENEEMKYIAPPSDSMIGITVAAATSSGEKTDYSLSGKTNTNKYFSIKPDIAATSIDQSGAFVTITEGMKNNVQGTSFATPMIVRKVAELYADGIELYMIPAIFNAIATYYSKKNIPDDYLGFGNLPLDINKIRNLSNDNCLLCTKISIDSYNQGFYKFKLPKGANNKYYLNFVMGVNVIANFNDQCSFEYVEDTARVQFGAVSPFVNSKGSIPHHKLEENWKIQDIKGDADDGYTYEKDLRRIFNKYKNRYVASRISERSRLPYITKSGEKKDIEYWGFSIVRNDIKSTRKDDLDVYICLIVNSIDGNEIYEQIKNSNSVIYEYGIDITNTNDDIRFE